MLRRHGPILHPPADPPMPPPEPPPEPPPLRGPIPLSLEYRMEAERLCRVVAKMRLQAAIARQEAQEVTEAARRMTALLRRTAGNGPGQ